MEKPNRWPASALMTTAMLAVATAAGWYDATAQSGARSAAMHAAQEQRAGLEARVATLVQDLSHANAEARAFAVQATDASAASRTPSIGRPCSSSG
jgi:hypothetical protein